MGRPRANRKPVFRTQATLIVLPVLILAAVGVWSLRQDRSLVEQEARERARQIAELLLPEMVESVAGLHATARASTPARSTAPHEDQTAILFQISQDGALLSPAPLADPVPNPLDPDPLDPDSAQLWHAARNAEYREGAAAAALKAYRDFLDRHPPDHFSAAARMSVAILESRQDRLAAARDQLELLIRSDTDTRLESGLPASSVAALKLIELARIDPATNDVPWSDLLDTVCSNAVEHPTWVSRPLLDAATELAEALDLPAMKRWRSLWLQHEEARQLYADARPQLQRAQPVAFWIVSRNTGWLVLREPEGSDADWVVCLPERMVGANIDARLSRMRNVPPYFGLGITIASRAYRLGPSPKSLPGEWQSLLAGLPDPPSSTSDPSFHPASGGAPSTNDNQRLAGLSAEAGTLGAVRVDIFLDDPPLLFARQRIRTRWFAALIAASTVVALVGLVTTWRAFHRQQLLATMQSRFVSSVSHELRAPIGSIRLLAEGLESGRIHEPERQAEYFGLMGQECRRLTALVENVLDFSRIDQGRKQYEFEPTDIVALVQQTVRLMEPQAAQHQVTLALSLPHHPDPPSPIPDDRPPSSAFHSLSSVLCPSPSLDGRAMQQALVNLIDNAIKHAPPDSIVEIGLAFEPPPPAIEPAAGLAAGPPRSALRLWVRDSGEGIPASEHEKIFEPFYRRGTELRRETTGIGIGLSIVKHVVDAHGGRVTVESEPGRGSTFTLHLP